MQKKSKLWQAFLAVGIAALTVPSFAYSEGGSTESPSAAGSASMSAEAETTATSDEGKTAADKSLNQNVRQALNADTMLSGSAKGIKLKTEEGEVTLEGSVMNKDAKEMIETKVKAVEGVKDVNNELEVAETEMPESSMPSAGGGMESGPSMEGSSGGSSVPGR